MALEPSDNFFALPRMSDLTPDASSPSATGAAAVAAAEDDPFLRLHKMSTTAGLGSGDYVAINGNAIAAVLLGIASAFLLMGTNLLLILPLAGIVCAILALRQINDSNGTQTGTGLAALGLLLSLGFGGFFTGTEAVAAIRNHADSEQIVDLIHEFSADVKAGDYAKGYALWDARFQSRVPLNTFTGQWDRFASMSIGRITDIDWNHLMEFDNNVVTGEREASGQIVLSFANVPGKDRQPIEFRKLDGKWWFYDAPVLFPVAAPGQTPATLGMPPSADGAAGGGAPGGGAGPSSPVQGPPVPTPAR
jgi:hypothetical protein